MSELKTKPTTDSPTDYLVSIENPNKRRDAEVLLTLFEEASGCAPVLWNNNMIGYGTYHYESERSNQQGDWPLTAFAPRKAAISIYIMPGVNKYPELLSKLGKHRKSQGSCLYVNKLSDINLDVLSEIIRQSVTDVRQMYPETA